MPWLIRWRPHATAPFGKDGYVHITDDNGRLTGGLFSVQVKGGESWAAADGYRIPVGKHRDVWMYYTVPVIGVVHDPKDGRLRWANLTAALREDRELASVHVLDGALFDEDEQLQKLIQVTVRVTTWPGLPMALGSDSDDEPEAAVWDCFAIARRNADALVAVRCCFLALGERGRLAGLVALAFCTPHPDIFWTKQNTLPNPIQRAVCASMRWNVPEVWQLLEMVDPETIFERGSVGQCVYMLLFEDPTAGNLPVERPSPPSSTIRWPPPGQRPYTCTSSAKAARPSGLGSVPSALNSLMCHMRNTSPGRSGISAISASPSPTHDPGRSPAVLSTNTMGDWEGELEEGECILQSGGRRSTITGQPEPSRGQRRTFGHLAKLIAHDLVTTIEAAERRFVHYRPNQVQGLVGVVRA